MAKRKKNYGSYHRYGKRSIWEELGNFLARELMRWYTVAALLLISYVFAYYKEIMEYINSHLFIIGLCIAGIIFISISVVLFFRKLRRAGRR